MTEMITLYSPYAGLTVTLVPPAEVDDPRTGKRITDPGVKVKFNNGRALATPEQWERLQEAPCFTGIGASKSVFTEDEATAMPKVGEGRPTVVTGAIGTKPTAAGPPSADWDGAGAVALARRIGEGEFAGKLDSAFAYERTRQAGARKTVLRALTEAMLGPDPEPLPAAEGEPELVGALEEGI